VSILAINRRLDIVYCASFCLLLLTLLAFDLRMSYFQAESEARADVSNSSFLISEWIKGSFDSSDYVLRDIVSRGNELGAPVVDSHAGLKQRRMNLLEAKRKSLPNAFTVALYDQNCIAVHSNTSPRFDASSREYCQVLRSNPAIESMVTHAFFSSLGRLNVVQARRIPGNSPGFHGLALFGIDLGFFSRLVDQVSTRGHGNVVIIDANRVLLARKPHIPEQLGKALDNPALEAHFVDSFRAGWRAPLVGGTQGRQAAIYCCCRYCRRGMAVTLATTRAGRNHCGGSAVRYGCAGIAQPSHADRA